MIIGTKFDVFATQFESVKKKQLCLAMRYIAHLNGCDLVFSSVREKIPSQLYRAMIQRHVFDTQIATKIERDHNQCLNVYSGQDTFLNIGEPEVREILIAVGSGEPGQGELRADLAGDHRAELPEAAGEVEGGGDFGGHEAVRGGEGGRNAAAEGRGAGTVQERHGAVEAAGPGEDERGEAGD